MAATLVIAFVCEAILKMPSLSNALKVNNFAISCDQANGTIYPAFVYPFLQRGVDPGQAGGGEPGSLRDANSKRRGSRILEGLAGEENSCQKNEG